MSDELLEKSQVPGTDSDSHLPDCLGTGARLSQGNGVPPYEFITQAPSAEGIVAGGA